MVDEIVNSERDPRDNPLERVEMTVSLIDKSEAIKNENNLR